MIMRHINIPIFKIFQRFGYTIDSKGLEIK